MVVINCRQSCTRNRYTQAVLTLRLHSATPQADVPFEQLAAQRAGGGARAARLHSSLSRGRSSSRGDSGAAGADAAGGSKDSQARHRKEKPHRENKNRPAEASSRRPVSRLRDVVQAPKT